MSIQMILQANTVEQMKALGDLLASGQLLGLLDGTARVALETAEAATDGDTFKPGEVVAYDTDDGAFIGVVSGSDPDKGVVHVFAYDGTEHPLDLEGTRPATLEEAEHYRKLAAETEAAASAAAVEPPADQPKKGRGRPAGSKNKPKEPEPPPPPVEEPATEEEEGVELQEGDIVIVNGKEEGIFLGWGVDGVSAKVRIGKRVSEVGINLLSVPAAETEEEAAPSFPPTRAGLKDAMQAFLDKGNDMLALRGILKKHGCATGRLADVPEANIPAVIADMAA